MTQFARKLDKATDEFIEAIGIAMDKLANCCSLIDEAGDDGPESIAETNMLLLDFFLLVKALSCSAGLSIGMVPILSRQNGT